MKSMIICNVTTTPEEIEYLGKHVESCVVYMPDNARPEDVNIDALLEVFAKELEAGRAPCLESK